MAWLIFNDAAVSVVEHWSDPTILIVRARHQGDIGRFLGPLSRGVKIQRTPENDYLFRAHCSREMVAQAVAARVVKIDYPNFKDSVKDKFRKGVYSSIWSAWLRLQRGVGLYGRWYANYDLPASTVGTASAAAPTISGNLFNDPLDEPDRWPLVTARNDPYGNHAGGDGYPRRRPWYRDEPDDDGNK